MLSPSRAALLGAALAAFTVGAAADADAAQRGGVRIASPKPNALVTGQTVPVKLTTGAKVTAVKVFDGTRDVTKRFKRDGSTWRAQLALKPGSHDLLVQSMVGKSGGDAKRVTFIVGRDAPASATVRSGARASAAISQGPAHTRSYQPTPGQAPVAVHTKAPSIATLTVNGHKVADRRGGRFLRDHSWLVSTRDGLRAGTNRFVLETYDKQGRHAVKRWTKTRGTQRPLAEAGPRESKAKATGWTRLDGTGSKATQRGADLSYAWRVVKAPKGAKPQLRNANSARPQFKPDGNGFYQVAVRVTQTAKGRASAAAAPTTSEDVITLGAWPTLPSQGMYVDTGLYGQTAQMTPPYNSLWFWGSAYPAFTGDPNVCLQFDDTTLGTVDYGMPKDFAPVEGRITVCAWGATSLTGDNAISWMPFAEDNGSAIWIDTKLVAYNGSDDDWGPDTGNPTSNLHGWLKPATSSTQASWVDSDMVPVQTRSTTDTATTNTMVINGTAVGQTLPAGSIGGFQLVVLDHGGAVATNKAYAYTTDASSNAPVIAALTADLNAAGTESTVLLQAFGSSPILPDLNLGLAMAGWGANPDVIARLNGTADATGAQYALIGGRHVAGNTMGMRAKEASFERTGTGASLTSLLVRDSGANNYIPLSGDFGAPDVAGFSRSALLPTVYAAPNGWTNWMPDGNGGLRAATAAENAAFADITTEVTNSGFLVGGVTLCPAAPDAIRAYYCNTNSQQVANLGTDIHDDLDFNATTAGGRYTATDFANVQQAIQVETLRASNIQSAMAEYTAIFGTETTDGAVNAANIGSFIRGQVSKSNGSFNANGINIASAVTDIISATPEIGPVFTAMSGALSLTADLLPNSSPITSILDNVQVTQNTVSANLTTSYKSASTQLWNYASFLVSDPVKLQTGATLLGGKFAIGDGNRTTVENVGEYAANQYLWGSMLAPAYAAWTAPTSMGNQPWCASDHYTWQPFKNASPSGYFSAGGTEWLLAINVPDLLGWNSIALPNTITDPLFAKVDPTVPVSSNANGAGTISNSGAIMPYFMNDYLKTSTIPIASTNDPMKTPGCYPGNS